MRGLVAVSLLLLLASTSGCVSLVDDNSDPDVEAAAADAQKALDDYQAKAGHISGTVTETDGTPLKAVVDLLDVEAGHATDDKGRFAFLDLKPGTYVLQATAPDHLPLRLSVDVAPGQFAKPAVVLERVKPAPYSTVFHFDGYQDIGTLGFALSCYCDFEDDMAFEGLEAAVLEAQAYESSPLPFLAGAGFEWQLESWDADGNSAYALDSYNYGESPLRADLAADDFAPEAVHWALHIAPDSGLADFQQAFDGYLTLFYYGPAPDGYTAYAGAA